jgi:hypothetical protein
MNARMGKVVTSVMTGPTWLANASLVCASAVGRKPVSIR